MKVRDFMSTQVITASSSTSLPEIWKLIFNKHIHGLPVVDKDNRLLGIISEEDILRRLFPEEEDVVSQASLEPDLDDEIKLKLNTLQHLKAKDLMNSRVIYTRLESNLMRALSRMIVRKVRQLPVLDDNDQVVGMLSKGDIFDILFKQNIKKLVG